MNATTKSDITPVHIDQPRRTLLDEHASLGSWQRVANSHRVNVRYVWEYAVLGKIPHNASIRRRLGIRRTASINQLLKRPIIDQPTDVLLWAYENRETL